MSVTELYLRFALFSNTVHTSMLTLHSDLLHSLCFSSHCECYFSNPRSVFLLTVSVTFFQDLLFYSLWVLLFRPLSVFDTLHSDFYNLNSESFTPHTTLQTLCTTLCSSYIHSSHFYTLHFILTDFALCSTRICALWTLHLCRLCTFIFEHSALGSSIFFSSSHLTSLKFALYTLPLYTLHLYLLSLHLFCTLLLTLHSTYTYTSTQGQTPLQTSIFLMLRNCTTLCPTSLDSATQIQSTTCSHTK